MDPWNPCDFHPWLVGTGMAPRAWTALHGRDYLPPPWNRGATLDVAVGSTLIACVARTLRSEGETWIAGLARRGFVKAVGSGDPLPVRLVVSP
jgi:hypothetical protein